MNGGDMIWLWLGRISNLPLGVAVLCKVSVLLFAAWCVHAALWRANPRWRVVLWRTTAVGLLAIPLLHIVIPPTTVYVDNGADVELTPLTVHQPAAIDGNVAQTPRIAQDIAADAAGPSSLASASGTAISHENSIGVSTILLAGWLMGIALVGIRFGLAMRRLRQIVDSSQPVPIRVSKECERVAKEFSLSRVVKLRQSDEASSPLLCRVFSPVLLLPAHFCKSDAEEQLPGILAHELSHAQSRDLFWNSSLHLIASMLWFHPFAWFMRSSHASSCEAVGDAVAVNYLGDVTAYSRTLARVALQAAQPPLPSLGMARVCDVRRRIQALERFVFGNSLRKRSVGVFFFIGVIIVTLIGGLQVAIATEPPDLRLVPDAATVDGDENVVAKKDDKHKKERSKKSDKQAIKNESPHLDQKTKTAIKRALNHLAKNQNDNGSFGDDGGPNERVAVTSIAGLAFLAEGSTPKIGPYARPLRKATEFLLTNQRPSGLFASKASRSGTMYGHGYAVRFLAQLHQVQPKLETAKALLAGVELIVKSQNDVDGWRYQPISQDADICVVSCQIIALQSAKRAGTFVPDETLRRGLEYVMQCQAQDGGFNYQSRTTRDNSGLARSAAAMAALLHSGTTKGRDVKRGLDYLSKQLAKNDKGNQPFFFYSQFYLCEALRLAGKEHFDRWYPGARDRILDLQDKDGSWPDSNVGPEYATASASYILLSPRLVINETADKPKPAKANFRPNIIIVMKNGKVITGRIVGQDPQSVVIKTANGDVRVKRFDIEAIRAIP
ncbi:MAG: hypothetical protein IH991_00380 [Planctomycetes bacterium]|nr:hypothetical protein [Planctomycetota bacterium]